MSRTRNATEFRTTFLGAKGKYDLVFRPRIDKLRAALEGASPPVSMADVDESLEHHARCYIINALLEALNWRLNSKPDEGLPNLLPEATVRSDDSGTRRFLDYLGFERNTLKPLLVVEAKRLKVALPLIATLPKPGTKSAPTIMDDALLGPSAVVSQGLAGTKLSGEWSKWLAELKDYVRSVHTKTNQIPKRVVMTNGGWLILLLEPTQAFLNEAVCPPEGILVYNDGGDIALRSGEIFRALEHQHVLNTLPFLDPAELPYHVTGPSVRSAMHGLRLRYEQTPALKQAAPIIHVAPVVILRTDLGATIRVENPDDQFELPHAAGQIAAHLAEVRDAAEILLRASSERLATPLVAAALENHFEDPLSFEAQKGVSRSAEDEYFLVTGQHTHYLRAEPSMPDCPYHEWAKSSVAGVAVPPGPIMVSNVQERSFFSSGEMHHCTHRGVFLSKASEISPQNEVRCGPRSGQYGEAFCEIWGFERRLCCRTCAYERVCTKAQVFQLPCQVLVHIAPVPAAANVAAPAEAAPQ